MLDLLRSEFCELDVPECGQEMYLCDALVGLERTTLHGVLDRILVLRKELSHGDVRRHEHPNTVIREGVRQFICNLLTRLTVNAAPLPLRPITALPAPVWSLAGTATLSISVLLHHERTSSSSSVVRRGGQSGGQTAGSTPQ